MFPFKRPEIVPLAFWRQARPVRIFLWCCAVAPMVMLAAGVAHDFVRHERSGRSDGGGWFLHPRLRLSRVMLVPTRLTVGTFAVALAATAAGGGWYHLLKRRVFHQVWKREFQVCTTCGGDWEANSSLYCPGCSAAPPGLGLERAWKEWYESKHDEPEIDLSSAGSRKARWWMGD